MVFRPEKIHTSRGYTIQVNESECCLNRKRYTLFGGGGYCKSLCFRPHGLGPLIPLLRTPAWLRRGRQSGFVKSPFPFPSRVPCQRVHRSSLALLPFTPIWRVTVWSITIWRMTVMRMRIWITIVCRMVILVRFRRP